MKNVSSGGLIALMVLSVSAAAGTPNTKPNCTKESCTVNVMVNGNSCGGGIAMSPDPIITAVGSGPVTITWKAIGEWDFDPAKGIEIVEPGDTLKVAKMKEVWSAVNDTKKKGVWRYDVNLVKKGSSGEKCSRDPTIINH